jgi:peptide/nickel transport system substrate-binding protein
VALCAAALMSAGCVAEAPPRDGSTLTVSVEQQAAWTRNFNPLASNSRWPTASGIYEPMLVFNRATQTYVLWLATAYRWDASAKNLTLTIREGVRWSDTRPMSSKDVAFTFRYLKKHPGLDQAGLWKRLDRISLTGPSDITFHFKAPFAPGLDFVAGQPIVPEHIWSEIDSPVTFANPSPVATGPFTEVLRFQNQIYELGKNPHYWQPGIPRIDTIQCPSLPGNDAANLALVSGEVDWAGNFVPAIDRIFVERDPEHHRYWFPLTGTMVFLYANTQRAPFGEARVRKALSMALDRELMARVAMYRYTQPADPSGLGDAFESWRNAGANTPAPWLTFDPKGAEKMLDEAGFARGADGLRRGPDGAPFKPEILVVNQWSDWVRAAQIVQKSLESIGVAANVRAYDFSAWFERVQKGEFDLAIGWSTEGATPYGYFRWLMDPETVKPMGELSSGNWHRYGDPESRALLAKFEAASDTKEQEALIASLQRRFVTEAPAIPLFPNPAWGAFNSSRIEGFPDAENPYAPLAPYEHTSILVLTRLRPAGTK